MKRFLPLLLLIPLTGCMSSQMPKMIKALGQDKATINITVTSIYGTIHFSRTNPGSNTVPHSVSADGIISVTKP